MVLDSTLPQVKEAQTKGDETALASIIEEEYWYVHILHLQCLVLSYCIDCAVFWVRELLCDTLL